MSRVFGRIFLLAIFFILTGSSLVRAASGNQTMKLKDVASGNVVRVGSVKFVKVAADKYLALDLCPTDSTYSSFYKGCVVKTTDFVYTGDEQTFSAPADGYYVLEVWGAQGGGASTLVGGYGGYSIGLHKITNSPKTLYINVGGQGTNISNGTSSTTLTGRGGYNGGGNSYSGITWTGSINGSGGGATHVATVTGVLSNLSTYQDSDGTNISREILIVAGAGGGSAYVRPEDCGSGGHGGGIVGNNGKQNTGIATYTTGGSQTAGGCLFSASNSTCNAGFGYGMNMRVNGDGYHGAAGGGGWYGGGAGNYGFSPGGGGGSGYIASSSLLSTRWELRHMTCYNCTTSTDPNTYTVSNTCASETPTADCAKIGHGAARITQLAVYLGI